MKDTIVYTLPRQMPKETWHRLVRALFEHEVWFGVVWRGDLGVSRRAQGVRTFLKPLSFERRRASQWPGTRLHDAEATVVRYRTSPTVLPLFLATDSLFDWRAPDLPEDPFFGSGESELALVSVTHERDAWLLQKKYARVLGQEITLARERMTVRDRLLLEGAKAP